MAKNKITGKTFAEMLSESTILDLSAKFKNGIYEHSKSVHSMGIVIHLFEEDGAIFLFKDADFTEPVTDNELLAMYLDEVKPVYLTGRNIILRPYSNLTAQSNYGIFFKYCEYKDENLEKRFYKIENDTKKVSFFSGETYESFYGSVPGKNKFTRSETLWEGAFTGESGYGGYVYKPSDLQNISLLMDTAEVRITYDGEEYVSFVDHSNNYHMAGNTTMSYKEYPFAVSYTSSGTVGVTFTAVTEGEHTIKIQTMVHSDEITPAVVDSAIVGTDIVG